MNILFISSWFPNDIEPLNGIFVKRHAEAVSLFHHVEVLHTIGDPNQKENFVFKETSENGIKTLIVYYKNTRISAVNFYRRMKAYRLGFRKMTIPDLVHANILHNNMLFAVYLKKKFKIPFVVSEHWTALRSINHHKMSYFSKKIAKHIANNASRMLPVSKDLAKGLKKLEISTKFEVIPNVVDTKLFFPSTKKNNCYTFVHISSLISRKNPDKIIQVAIRLLKQGYEFNLIIAGNNDNSELKKIVTESNFENNVQILGALPLESVAEIVNGAHCFILFSEDENQPCVIGESFAAGVRVISTNVGGVAEFFPENFGILLQKTDPLLLENAMIEMLSHKNTLEKEMINYAYNTFSKEVIGRKIAEVYNTILN